MFDGKRTERKSNRGSKPKRSRSRRTIFGIGAFPPSPITRPDFYSCPLHIHIIHFISQQAMTAKKKLQAMCGLEAGGPAQRRMGLPELPEDTYFGKGAALPVAGQKGKGGQGEEAATVVYKRRQLEERPSDGSAGLACLTQTPRLHSAAKEQRQQ